MCCTSSPPALQRSRRWVCVGTIGIPRGPWKMQSAERCQEAAWKKTWALESMRASVQVHAQPRRRVCPGAGSQVLVHRWPSSGERTLTSPVPRRADFVPDAQGGRLSSLWGPLVWQLGQPCDWQVSWSLVLPGRVSATPFSELGLQPAWLPVVPSFIHVLA